MRYERHGHGYESAEYRAWKGMKNRCCNPNNTHYRDYGGRGITVADQWLHSFTTFLADMGKKPTANLTLERINNDGNYEPGNCKWATQAEQQNNRRFCHLITLNGKTQNLTQWAKELGIKRTTLSERTHYGKVSITEALKGT